MPNEGLRLKQAGEGVASVFFLGVGATFGSTASTQSDCAYGQRDVCVWERGQKGQWQQQQEEEEKKAAKWQRQRLIGLAAAAYRERERMTRRGTERERGRAMGNRNSCAFP